jgi:hypothetical protein
MATTTERTDEELYEILKDLPDFDRLPLPKHWYEKFNIPPPKILSFMQAYELMIKTANAPGPLVKTETRPPAEGGVRPLLEVEPVKVEVITDVSGADLNQESERRDSQTEGDVQITGA